jgi:hypothetical protein
VIEIRGFTELQRDLADRLWQCNTTAELDEFIGGLPRSLKREAWVVQQMIIANELDSHMEVADEVRDYLGSR